MLSSKLDRQNLERFDRSKGLCFTTCEGTGSCLTVSIWLGDCNVAAMVGVRADSRIQLVGNISKDEKV
jgi:hypothetical protein